MMNDYDEQIRGLAHEIWQSEGRPHGQNEEHWQRARQEIESDLGVTGAEAAPRTLLRDSSSEPAQDGTSSGLKRRASASSSSGDGETSIKINYAGGMPTKASSRMEWSSSPATTAAERQGNMPSELGGRRGAHSEALLSAKYRHPENPNLTWSGRGRRRAWIRKAVEAGASLSDFEIGA